MILRMHFRMLFVNDIKFINERSVRYSNLFVCLITRYFFALLLSQAECRRFMLWLILIETALISHRAWLEIEPSTIKPL